MAILNFYSNIHDVFINTSKKSLKFQLKCILFRLNGPFLSINGEIYMICFDILAKIGTIKTYLSA